MYVCIQLPTFEMLLQKMYIDNALNCTLNVDAIVCMYMCVSGLYDSYQLQLAPG